MVDLPGSTRAVLVRPYNLDYSVEDDFEMLQDSIKVKVSFSLPPSAYATMAVREIMDILDDSR